MNEYTVYNDNRGQTGYSAMLLVKEPSDTLYSIICPLESVPSVFGSPESFDYNFLSAPTKGKLEGKEELETKDVEVFWHRDNALRLEALQGRVLDLNRVGLSKNNSTKLLFPLENLGLKKV